LKLPRHAEIWLAPYLNQRLNWWMSGTWRQVKRVWFTITDHYEPYWHNTDDQLARERVDRWVRLWPAIAGRHQDSTGRHPQYCFFYPEEEYRPHLMDSLSSLVRRGWGDVEIHLHHDRDTQQAFLERMNGFIRTLHTQHGLLRRNGDALVFGFIHGNWCLDNSRPDGRWCGLNNEITLLKQLGCYADFTMPCGPSPIQARTLNTIYWAVDDPAKPKSYDCGPRVGRNATGDLLMIPGPFGLRFSERIVPRMETGEIAHNDPPTQYRVKRWLDLAPVVGAECFVKLYTHGTQEKNSQLLLEGGLDELFTSLRAECGRRGWELRYATAWELRQAVDRAVEESGK
jgi:hypothetical protein